MKRNTVGSRIQKLRYQLGLTQEDLAKVADRGRSAVAQWERDDCEPPAPYTAHEAEQVARAMEKGLEANGIIAVATQLDKDVLEDAVDGNPWLMCMVDGYLDGEETKAALTRARRQCASIEAKLASAGIMAQFTEN